tara:strand:+ start:221 stop:664 length:444 start_codon:yes stop_codon:yes gene_type:complete
LSKFTGVTWHFTGNKWQVQIRVNRKQKHVGYFTDEVNAAHAYDAYAITNGVETTRNFPNENESEVVAAAARVRAAPKKRKKQKNAASKSSHLRGVSWDKTKKKWQVKIKVGGKQKHVGRFTDEETAGRAFDTYIVDNNLERELNFSS